MRNYAYYFIFFVSECDVLQPGLITDDSSTPVHVAAAAASTATQRSVFGIIRWQLARNDDHDLRVLFCFVPKAACTSWLRVLLRLTGNPTAQQVASADRTSMHILYSFYLERLFVNSTRQLARSPLKDYYKFTFVREPMERLVSAYRDKMIRDAGFMHIRRDIIRKFRRHPSPRYRHIIAQLLDVSHSHHVRWCNLAINKYGKVSHCKQIAHQHSCYKNTDQGRGGVGPEKFSSCLVWTRKIWLLFVKPCGLM